jgi:ubiquinone/menaquinone biosynthesis C-methylase UbiE
VTTAEVLAAHLERRAQPCSPTSEAYDALAPGYDVLTREYDHERWLSALERLARQHGLAGRRLLDVACGTGQSFLPLRTRGYEVTACDSSAGMLARAERKAPEASLHQLDMRELPVLGSFDLITCIDDSLNYLLEETELEGALAGIARNLAPGGIAVWDLNTIAQYRGQFARDHVVSEEAVFIGWQSRGADRETGPGDLVEIAIDVFVGDDREGWWRSTGVHTQRHWRRAVVERLARNAGLRVLDVRGQHPGVVIDSELDELAHTKAIYLACAKKGEPMHVGRP